MADWQALQDRIVRCRRCVRLRDHCREVARTRRAAYRDQAYWGRPVPNFGDPDGRLLIVGLAPAAHGANRTGRMFTGDRSGDFLYRALHEVGLASRPTATGPGDGLELRGVAITAAAHCAPPGNKPTRDELTACFDHFRDTVEAMANLRGLLALGAIAFDACIALYRARGWAAPRPKPKFAHGAFYEFDGLASAEWDGRPRPSPGAPGPARRESTVPLRDARSTDALITDAAPPFLAGCYHPSQQNTFTGRLTMEMLTAVLAEAAERARR